MDKKVRYTEKQTIDVKSKRMVQFLDSLGFKPKRIKEVDDRSVWVYEKTDRIEECISFYKWYWEVESKEWNK